MKEIVLDTETTGFDPLSGDKILEIGCVELENHIPTGNIYHVYINPEREVPKDSIRIHGLTDEFLSDKPVFSQIITEFLEFIKDKTLVIHNAEFDMKFLNAELQNIGFKELENEVIDTLLIARQKFPGSPANLDSLCRRFGVDNSNRQIHGALLDSELLAEVYLELCGGRQPELLYEEVNKSSSNDEAFEVKEKIFREPREFKINESELMQHKEMLEKISDHLWDN